MSAPVVIPPTQESETKVNPLRSGDLFCPICKNYFKKPTRGTRKYCTNCVPMGYCYNMIRNRVYKDRSYFERKAAAEKRKAAFEVLKTTEKMPSPTPDEEVADPDPVQPTPPTQEPEPIRPTTGVGRSTVMVRLGNQMKDLDKFFDTIGSKKTFTKTDLLRHQADFLDTSVFVYNWLKYEVEGE
jgi:hypothetical protein